MPDRQRQAITVLTGLVAAAALLWPSPVLGPLDGAPLSGRAEALLIGLAVPALCWLQPAVLRRLWMRSAIAALLVTKIASGLLTPQGLCARFTTLAPLQGVIQTIPIEEPGGALRSWDVRADWQSPAPGCTAVVDRAYASAADFPAWFLNILDFVRPGRREITLELTGYATVADTGVLEWRAGEDMTLEAMQPVHLSAGVHPITLRATLSGDRWRLEPRWNGDDAWQALTFTRRAPGTLDTLAPVIGLAMTMLTAFIVAAWVVSTIRVYRGEWAMLAWVATAATASVVMAADERLARFAAAVLLAAACVPVASKFRNLRGAFLLVGVPWLAFFAARAWDQIGRFTIYSADDWLTYQIAGYRIFMHGYWLQGGTAAFDYQPLYRWMSGALHLVFGDSSVGELFWDAACLLAGALLAFHLTRVRAGFRWALTAAAATLATFTLGTSWYFLGRGLSEIAAAGWAFLAAFFLLRARAGRRTSSAAAGLFALLMFYTRLNHLVFVAFLPALLLPVRLPMIAPAVVRAVARMRRAPLALYAGVFATGLAAFIARTWWYTGQVSLFYGTSLRHNDTGLRPWTVLDGDVWRLVGHSLAGLMFMNEPPRPDPRAIVVAAGMALAIAACLQVPLARRLPAAVVIALIGAAVGSLFAHTHNYPGRLSIHLVPLASALAATGAHTALAHRRRPVP